MGHIQRSRIGDCPGIRFPANSHVMPRLVLLRFILALLLPLSFSLASAQVLLPCHAATGDSRCCASAVCEKSSAIEMGGCAGMCAPGIATLPAFAITGDRSAGLTETAETVVRQPREIKPPVPPPRVS